MKNKNIIKALAIGISASMALQPVTVLAEGEAVEPVTAKQNDAVDTAAEVVSSDANTLGEDAVKVDAAADVVSEQKKNNVAPTTYDEIKKIENASSASDAMAALMETMSLADKYKDVKEEEFTDAQKQRAEELGRRIEAASDKFENMFGDEEEAEDAEEVVEDAEELVEEVVEE